MVVRVQQALRLPPESSKLRRELGRLDTVLFLIAAVVVIDTLGAVANGRRAGAHLAGWSSLSPSSFQRAWSSPSSAPRSRRRGGPTSGRGSRSGASPAP